MPSLSSSIRLLRFRLAKIKLPDSWFVVILALFLAATTWLLQDFVSRLPFWKAVAQRQINVVMHEVSMVDSQGGTVTRTTHAQKILMESLASATIPLESVNPAFERWTLEQWQSWIFPTAANQEGYFLQSPVAFFAKETGEYQLEGGVVVHAINHRNWERLANNLQTTAPLKVRSALVASSANMTLTTSMAHYSEGQNMVSMPHAVAMNLEGSQLMGDNLFLQLNSSTISMNNIQGQMLSQPLSRH